MPRNVTPFTVTPAAGAWRPPVQITSGRAERARECDRLARIRRPPQRPFVGPVGAGIVGEDAEQRDRVSVGGDPDRVEAVGEAADTPAILHEERLRRRS